MGAGYQMLAKANAAAEIYIYEDVGESWWGGVTASQFAADLKALGDVRTIDLRINSYGGDVFDGVAIYRQLVDHAARVVAHIDGIAASIASVIAMAGDEIRISETGFVMIHNAAGACFGMADDMRKVADLLDTVSGAIADVYAARTGNARDQVLGWMDAETWFTGPDALANKFADQMDANLKVAAYADAGAHQFTQAPAGIPRDRVDRRPKPVSAARILAQHEAGRAAPSAPAAPLSADPLLARVALQRARLAAHHARA